MGDTVSGLSASAMQLIIESQPVPIAADADGVYRVGRTRLTLDTVVAAFHDGATPEEIVQQYPAIELEHAYSVIGYYLRHQAEVDAYLSARADSAARVRSETERAHPPQGLRERLMARRPSAQ
jgi:uncharacterized protein (DUF433 family)